MRSDDPDQEPDEPSLLYPDGPPPRPPTTRVGLAVQSFALQDWILVIYVCALGVAALAGGGPRRGEALGWIATDLLLLLGSLVLVRGGVIRHAGARNLLYRFVIFGTLLGTFAQLPCVFTTSSTVRDAELYAFDLRVFGVEPAVAMQAWTTPPTTEWFSFFYYSYFFLLSLYVFPMMFLERRTHVLAEFTLGVCFLVCAGHVGYLLVPALGPYRALQGQFHMELSGGVWWPTVRQAVESGGLRKDVFPSLHTAMPSFLTLFSMRHRRLTPFAYAWPMTSFFTSQIIIATMYLRWHYLVDIFAGLALASLSAWISTAAGAEARERERFGIVPTISPMST